jgi:hypothetical protein
VESNARVDEASLKARAARLLITTSRVLEEARQTGLEVSMGRARDQLRLLRFEQLRQVAFEPLPQDPELRSLLLAPHLAQPDAEWLMRLNLLAAKVEQARLNRAARELPRSQVAAFYALHRAQFVEPAMRDIEIIGNDDGAVVRKAKREIEGGMPFLDVARHASNDPEAPEGLQRLVQGTEEPPFEREIFGARAHVLTGPVKQVLSYLFVVLAGHPARQETLPQAEWTIRRRLAPRRAARILAPALEARWTAQTRCRPGYVVSGCSEYK